MDFSRSCGITLFGVAHLRQQQRVKAFSVTKFTDRDTDTLQRLVYIRM